MAVICVVLLPRRWNVAQGSVQIAERSELHAFKVLPRHGKVERSFPRPNGLPYPRVKQGDAGRFEIGQIPRDNF